MGRLGAWLALVTVAAATLSAKPAQAQTTEYSDLADETVIASQEWGAWEILAVGPYQPKTVGEADPPLEAVGGDNGPLLTTELEVYIWRIPYIGPIAAGLQAGWAKYEGETVTADGTNTGEKTKVVIFPITPMAVLRIDLLAREWDIPILFAGKIGLQMVPWKAKKGGVTEGSDVAFGLRWGAEVALELDFLEPRAARRLDEEWGINHSFLFAELFGSTASGGFGDAFAWSLGLGFVY